MAIIITGHQRSGTSLLRKVCNSHPGISITSEVGCFLKLGAPYDPYAARMRLRRLGVGLRSWPIYGKPVSGWSYPRVVVRNHLFLWRFMRSVRHRRPAVVEEAVIESVLRELLDQPGLVGDKYPEYIYALPDLVKAGSLTRLVICRDGRDVVSSVLRQIRTGWRGMPWFIRKLNTVEKIARRWAHSIEMMESHRERLRIIRYEDLVQDPEKQLRELGQWLNVDPDQFRRKTIKQGRVGFYKSDLSAADLDQIQNVAGPVMRRWGYL